MSDARGEVELVVDAQHLTRVVREGLAKATVSVAIATADFKAMLVPGRNGGRNAPSIIELFVELARRGVEVRLLHAGIPSGPARQQLRKVQDELVGFRRKQSGGLIIRRCPRLHAKAVIVDSRWLYLGSANLTGAGLGAKSPKRRNFEWGMISRSAPLIDGVLEQFNAIWEGHRCEDCGRREVCPVPLEEPAL